MQQGYLYARTHGTSSLFISNEMYTFTCAYPRIFFVVHALVLMYSEHRSVPVLVGDVRQKTQHTYNIQAANKELSLLSWASQKKEN